MGSRTYTPEREVRIRAATDGRQLPSWLSARLRVGARRAEHLRLDIAAQAGLPTLPPIEICPEVWRSDGDLVLGCTGMIARDDELHLGVLLPAPTAVQSDDDLLRSVLVRQFCDCISRLVLAATKNTAVSTATPFADPTCWFGPADVARLKNWKDHKIPGLEVIAALLAKSLPTVAPPPDDVARDLNIPNWVIARLEPSVEHSPVIPGGQQ